ncbi:MAG: glycosyltransferase family 1 protein [Bdellovibrionales bacterium]|nr:glycosyltransferase family 1 protein [Bdellovibrionales bacterium]
MPKLLIATDAWKPQINGVVRTLTNTISWLENAGYTVEVIHPNLFRNVPCPFYSEIQLALPAPGRIRKIVEKFEPDHIHIATEGPIGLQLRRLCVKRGWNFTTSFHTRFPEYLQHLAKIPQNWTWPLFRWFHGASSKIMAPSQSFADKLKQLGFNNVDIWSRGIDLGQFAPREKNYPKTDRPILMYIGRISKEKNVEAFLAAEAPGTKYLVGDGPIKKQLEKKYPDAKFLGYKTGEDLAQAYANADVFVFPSLTDTFGNVILEALASGVPVAAFPATGPIDILVEPQYGCCDEDLSAAIKRALDKGDPQACVEYARTYTWENASKQFAGYLVPHAA